MGVKMMKKMLSTALMAVTVSALALSGCAKKEETKPAASGAPACLLYTSPSPRD